MAEKQKFNILFTCVGRRVSLIKSFRDAAKQIKLDIRVFGTDITVLSSALQVCDVKFTVKPISHPGYLGQLLKIVKENNINLLVPTVDTELLLLAENRDKLIDAGCYPLISEPKVVKISQDKRKTFQFLIKNGFDSPKTWNRNDLKKIRTIKWPLLLKPWDGSASKGVCIVNNKKELEFFSKKIKRCIVQEFIHGTEYTCDVFVDMDMKVRCVVPRKRIETRSGEVSKSQTVKHKEIMEKTAEMVTVLKAGPGIITVQAILTYGGEIKFIEINPRFGGGFPLTMKAGANFPKWILQQMAGKKPIIKFDGFEDKLLMLRYDAEVWIKNH